jgi:hypothetical protein
MKEVKKTTSWETLARCMAEKRTLFRKEGMKRISRSASNQLFFMTSAFPVLVSQDASGEGFAKK